MRRGDRNGSISSRLFVSAAAWSFAVLLVAGVILSAVYERASVSAFDERLHVYIKQLVADLAGATEAERQDLGNLGEPRFELQSSGWYWEIIRLGPDESLVKASRSLFGSRFARLPEPEAGGAGASPRRGYVTGPDEHRLRVVERRVDLGDDGRFLFAVGAATDEIEASIADFRMALGLTFLLLGLALVATTLFQVRYGLRPLANLSAAVSAVREGQAERIGGEYPPDLAPLADELNLLIDTNRNILERARTQVGNLAHALKTPLSVMLNEADAGGRGLPEMVREQAAVMRHQVDYHLNRARAAALAGALGSGTEVEPAVAALVRVFEKVYAERGTDFELAVQGALRFRGEKQDFEEMVGNLIDNAGKWAASKVLIRITPAGDRRRLILTVEDDGPGVPEERRAEMVKRGRRLDETKPGSGLGLSIVDDFAASYGGLLDLGASPLGGLRAELTLPAL